MPILLQDTSFLWNRVKYTQKCINYFNTFPQTCISNTFLHVWEIWWPILETGRFSLYLGNSQIIRESWHRYIIDISSQWVKAEGTQGSNPLGEKLGGRGLGDILNIRESISHFKTSRKELKIWHRFKTKFEMFGSVVIHHLSVYISPQCKIT